MKEKILKFLFESSKTTGELLVSLGYEKTKYNAIDKDLKKLVAEGLIFSHKRKTQGLAGQPPTSYDVVYEIPILQRMWDEYSQLHLSMQKNDTVLEMLVKKQFWLIDLKILVAENKKDEELCKKCMEHLHESPLCAVTDQLRQRCLERAKQPPPIEDLGKEHFELFSGNRSNEIQNELKYDFKNRLKKSPYFFKTCLVNTHEELKEKINRIYSYGETPEPVEPYSEFSSWFSTVYGRQPTDEEYKLWAAQKKRPFKKSDIGLEMGAFLQAYLEKIFEICVYHDILDGEESEDTGREGTV